MLGIYLQSLYQFRLSMFAGQVGETGTGSGSDEDFALKLPGGETLDLPGGEPLEVPH